MLQRGDVCVQLGKANVAARALQAFFFCLQLSVLQDS